MQKIEDDVVFESTEQKDSTAKERSKFRNSILISIIVVLILLFFGMFVQKVFHTLEKPETGNIILNIILLGSIAFWCINLICSSRKLLKSNENT